MYRITGAFSSYIIQYFKELFLSFDTAKLGRFLLYRMKKKCVLKPKIGSIGNFVDNQSVQSDGWFFLIPRKHEKSTK